MTDVGEVGVVPVDSGLVEDISGFAVEPEVSADVSARGVTDVELDASKLSPESLDPIASVEPSVDTGCVVGGEPAEVDEPGDPEGGVAEGG